MDINLTLGINFLNHLGLPISKRILEIMCQFLLFSFHVNPRKTIWTSCV